MELLENFLSNCREAMAHDQTAVTNVVQEALVDYERFAAALILRPKPWFFAADEVMTVFCTEGGPGSAAAPHDHGTWSTLGCFAGSEESWWHETIDGAGIHQIGNGVLRSGEAHALPANTIHAVMNRWTVPNGIVHVYAGNFLATERSIWDPVTHERSAAGLSEPLAPADTPFSSHEVVDSTQALSIEKPALAGTAFAALSTPDFAATVAWLVDALGFAPLTTEATSCAIEEQFTYLIEPTSLTIIGIHAAHPNPTQATTTAVKQTNHVGLDHLALRIPSIAVLEQWRMNLTASGNHPSALTAWNFGTFVEVVGPCELRVRLFVPAIR
jgi:predicted metal-dependent enzyme (double-stranded beta helix superfamily)